VWQEISSKLKEEGVVEDLLSCFLFEKEGKLQEIVHLLKYRGVRSVGVELGRTLGGYVIRDARFASADYLIPVPLHRIKERERGYNQSDHICRGISGVTHIPIGHSLLLRTKYTQSQTKLNHEERRQNVGDAFAVHQKYRNEVGGKKLIIVDDVITTGSTINACAKVLNALGVKSVLAASAALAE
jgi:ComF family protein